VIADNQVSGHDRWRMCATACGGPIELVRERRLEAVHRHLGREPTQRPDAGARRDQAAMGFLLSTERLSTVVNGHYLHLLGRGIDLSGQATWVGILQAGGRDEAIIGGIIASAEYYANAAG
jgi:hypothetical protein